MARRKFGARHMAWVRSFRKKNAHRRHRRKRNPYPLAGTVAAINPRRRHRRHKRNPVDSVTSVARGTLGLPPLMPVVYGGAGFIGTAAVQGFVDTLVPASMKTNSDGSPSLLVKYGEILASIVIVTYVAKMVSRGTAAFAAVGGGIYAMAQAAHDFAPGVIPGMHAYTPLKAYSPVRRSSNMGRMGRPVSSAGGTFPQLATMRSRISMPQLAAPAFGQVMNGGGFAADGAMDMVQARFRRFA